MLHKSSMYRLETMIVAALKERNVYMTRSQKVVPGQGGLLFHEIKCPPAVSYTHLTLPTSDFV